MLELKEEQIAALLALSSRVEDLESAEAIRNLHATFVRAVADRRFEILSRFFTSDATIDMRFHGEKRGSQAIAEHFDHMVNSPLEGASYLLSSPVISASGDEGTGTWTWHRFHSTANVAGRTVSSWGVWEEGQYRCRYRRGADGKWVFSEMRFRMVRPYADPNGFQETND
ncbi:nuclear transport factor 2 family protein [Arthrobacter sp. 2MCAF15]|uniref:nuclear transport factor 2 family protein n=1 Tax=Arthrobacter sp. 2MCAF15 TaxID=3232984 RepID=UPI003F919A69